jgi:hypothetical protein
MCEEYLIRHLIPGYAAMQRIKLRLSLGDGFEGLPLCPMW